MVKAKAKIAYKKNATGQAVYDIYFSKLSAAEVARRHKLDRKFILEERAKKLFS